MKVSFPVMRGNMGGRQYHSLLISLSEIPHLFKFNDWEECTPELRAQRVLNKARVPDIAKYILNNEDGYLFSSVTASYSCPVNFIPSAENPESGTLEMELENVEFIINDGQHRCAAIAAVYEANEELLGKKIPKKGSAVYAEVLKTAVEYWTELSKIIGDWQRVKNGELSASELRQEKINTHAVVLRALGGVGRTLLEKYPERWQGKLKLLERVDWRKSVGSSANPLWDDVCITAGSVVSNRQARAATLAVLLREIGESPNGKMAHKESVEVISAQAT